MFFRLTGIYRNITWDAELYQITAELPIIQNFMYIVVAFLPYMLFLHKVMSDCVIHTDSKPEAKTNRSNSRNVANILSSFEPDISFISKKRNMYGENMLLKSFL